jgi:hypothetical protein
MQTTFAKDAKKNILLRSGQHRLIVEPAVSQKYFALLTEPHKPQQNKFKKLKLQFTNSFARYGVPWQYKIFSSIPR